MKEDKQYRLTPVDEVELVTLMDNYSDVLLPSGGVVTRPTLAHGGEIPTDTLLAEHGLSQLVRIGTNSEIWSVLFDTGYSPVGVPHNLARLGLDLKEIEAIVLSHGHMDHTGSLKALLKTLDRQVPLVVHPEAFQNDRFLRLPDRRELHFPQPLDQAQLAELGAEIIHSGEPVSLFKNSLLVTGQVPRNTDFEKGFPGAFLVKNGKEEPDAIWDDQSMVAHLKDKGLVVISGCAHAGIINTVQYARELTGVDTVYALIGGFHLTGPAFEPIIDRTVAELKKLDPKVIVPMHCTGWKAIQKISEAFPEGFVLNSVGSRITLK